MLSLTSRYLLFRELEAFKRGDKVNVSVAPQTSQAPLKSYHPEKSHQQSDSRIPAISQEALASQLFSTENITPELIKALKPKIEEYLKEKRDFLDCQNLFEAHVCLEIIKQLYNSKMKEYIKELGVISNKLKYYDEYIAKK